VLKIDHTQNISTKLLHLSVISFLFLLSVFIPDLYASSIIEAGLITGNSETYVAQFSYDFEGIKTGAGNSPVRGAQAVIWGPQKQKEEVAFYNTVKPVRVEVVLMLLGVWGLLWWGLPALAAKKCKAHNCSFFHENELKNSPLPFVCLKIVPCLILRKYNQRL
jgi:hypothetical protein